MANQKRLAGFQDNILIVKHPLSIEEIDQREEDYYDLTPVAFAKKYRTSLFSPIEIIYQNKKHQIQVNHCVNPFCGWFGKAQVRFDKVKNKPYRYRIGGGKGQSDKRFICNPNPIDDGLVSLGCEVYTYSNWSVAEEIKRLAIVGAVRDVEPGYTFHKDDCTKEGSTPFNSEGIFRRRGKSTGKSTKWQCKECSKLTNVLPARGENFGYHQKRNDVIPQFAKLLLSHVPVKRSCEILGVSPTTYYNKLEWLYKRCLEFLELHETKALQFCKFDVMWLNTDQMIYFLNNVKKKGEGGNPYFWKEDLVLPTHIVISGDIASKYIFRADVAYDWQVTLDDLLRDTLQYKEDRLFSFARKNARYRFEYYPQHPHPEHEFEDYVKYLKELEDIEMRSNYVDGLHVNSTYTTMAHLWLIKQLVKTDKWRFVSDLDSSIVTAFFRMFPEEIKNEDAQYFTCIVDKGKPKKQAFKEYQEAREYLRDWGKNRGQSNLSLTELGILELTEQLESHSFYKFIQQNGQTCPIHAKNPIEHPLPSIDEGKRYIDCLTNMLGYTPEHIAKLIMKVNNQATNSFLQQIHRRLSILERPLNTARAVDGKSYIYANFNPKYAQYAVTILRTYYNFCLTYNSFGKKITPAQQLGTADRQYNMKDIIYFK